MPLEILNDRTRPRIVLEISDSDLRQRLAPVLSLPGTVVAAETLPNIDWNEWDVVVTDSPPLRKGEENGVSRRFPDHLGIFYVRHDHRSGFATLDVGIGFGWDLDYIEKKAVAGSDLILEADALSASELNLVREKLFDTANRRNQQWGVALTPSSSVSKFKFVPLLSGREGLAIACRYDRGNGVSHWLLPVDADLIPWIEVAFERWAVEVPEAFPSGPSWHYLNQWLSLEERGIEDRIRAADIALARAKLLHAEAIAADANARAEARARADSGPRRLLTESGQPLVEAAIDAFRTCGFDVEDMDQQHAEGSRREDLQLRDESEPGWIAITEVTGVKRGVSQMKWQKLLTHVNIYLRRDDASRTAVAWLVVNQEVGQAPEARSELWQADFRELVAQAGGLAIEAPALYRLLQRIDDATLRPTEARRALREAVGVFTLSDADALESNG